MQQQDRLALALVDVVHAQAVLLDIVRREVVARQIGEALVGRAERVVMGGSSYMEAPLRETKFGLVADVDGWFVLNARDSRWRDYGPLGKGCNFEGKRPFRQLGVNLNVLAPGESLGLYHRESRQEGFLVLSGECLLIVEGETRTLRAWDFFLKTVRAAPRT